MGVSGVGVNGVNWVGVLHANRNAVGGVLGSLLSLELHFEEFDFLLLLQESEFGLFDGGVVFWSLSLLLAVEDEAGDEVAAKANELRVAVVIAVTRGLIGSQFTSFFAVAA